MIEDPSGSIWLTDAWSGFGDMEYWRENYFDYVPANQVRYRIHNGGFDVVFADGHAKWLKAGSSRPGMWTIQAND